MVPAELLNNMAVLMMESDRTPEAYDIIKEAIANVEKLIQTKPDDSRLLALRITSKFNLGFWYEENHQLGEASEMYKQIIAEEPNYVDAYLRLAILARSRGDHRRSF